MGLRLNRYFVAGRVGRDPEVRSTTTGKKVSQFSIAVDTTKKDEPMWLRVVAWEKNAEFIEKYVRKGSALIIEGRLDVNTWEKDGVKHNDYIVVAYSINDVTNRNREDTSTGGGTDLVNDSDIPF